MEGEQAVLNVLPLCLAGDALEWHTDLPTDTKLDMNESLAEWTAQLLAEFKPDATTAHTEAARLKFRFATRDELSLSTYLRRKRALLGDADVTDTSSVVHSHRR